jgi:hypothetical protein
MGLSFPLAFSGPYRYHPVFPVITQFFLPLFSIWWEKPGEKRSLSGDNGFYRMMKVFTG